MGTSRRGRCPEYRKPLSRHWRVVVSKSMSQEDTEQKVALRVTWTDYAPRKLSSRIEEFKRRTRHIELDSRVEAIQFLRGTAARASQVLPALYLALGARSIPEDPNRLHWQSVQAAVIEQSALQTIALACRSIFDDNRGEMTGKKIARLSDDTLASVAKYWSERSEGSLEDASKALMLLRRLFARCAQPEKILIDQPSLLERRIGLLKYYAHRQAAHISLEDYLFDVLDLIHVVAAIVIVGSIIVEFDDPGRGEGYFDSIDEGGWRAAKELFPSLPLKRIFQRWNIHQQARLNWKVDQVDGVEFILNQLPSAIVYWDSASASKEQDSPETSG